MKITRRDLSVIMILTGVLAVFLVYQVYFTKKQAEVEALQAEQKSIQAQINELQPVKDNAPKYNSEMERFKTDLDEKVSEFPANVKYENGVMYMVELEENLAVTIPNFTVNEAEEVGSVEGLGSLFGYTYTLGKSAVNMSYTLETYDDMKEFINYVYGDEKNKRTISTMSMVFDNKTGEISGSVELSMFAMNDGTKIYEEEELPYESVGVESIFGEVIEEEEEEE